MKSPPLVESLEAIPAGLGRGLAACFLFFLAAGVRCYHLATQFAENVPVAALRAGVSRPRAPGPLPGSAFCLVGQKARLLLEDYCSRPNLAISQLGSDGQQ